MKLIRGSSRVGASASWSEDEKPGLTQRRAVSAKQRAMERGLRHRRLGSVLHEEEERIKHRVQCIEGSILGVSEREKVIKGSSKFERDIGGQIKHYQVHSLFRIGWLTCFRGSIVDNRTLQILFCVYCVAAAVFSLILCPSCKGQCSTCFEGIATAEGHKFSAVVSFLLAFFNGLTLSRWWTTRSRVGDVMSHSENFSVMASVAFPASDAQSQFVREELVRYVNLAHALMYKTARGMMDPGDLLECGLLTQGEWELLQKVENKYLQVHYWMADLLSRACAATAPGAPSPAPPPPPPGAIAEMYKSLRWQRENASTVLMHLTTQIPYPYVHLLAVIVRLHMMYITMTAATDVARAMELGQVASVFNAYVMLLVSTLVFEGLLQLHAMLYNPFSFYTCDLPCHSFADVLYRDTHSVLHAEHHLPYTTDVLQQLGQHPAALACATPQPPASGNDSGGGAGSGGDSDFEDRRFARGRRMTSASSAAVADLSAQVAVADVRQNQRASLRRRLHTLVELEASVGEITPSVAAAAAVPSSLLSGPAGGGAAAAVATRRATMAAAHVLGVEEASKSSGSGGSGSGGGSGGGGGGGSGGGVGGGSALRPAVAVQPRGVPNAPPARAPPPTHSRPAAAPATATAAAAAAAPPRRGGTRRGHHGHTHGHLKSQHTGGESGSSDGSGGHHKKVIRAAGAAALSAKRQQHHGSSSRHRGRGDGHHRQRAAAASATAPPAATAGTGGGGGDAVDGDGELSLEAMEREVGSSPLLTPSASPSNDGADLTDFSVDGGGGGGGTRRGSATVSEASSASINSSRAGDESV